ncbi:hypothetical protein PJP10_32770, partial [Mycobacterium kansasii]
KEENKGGNPMHAENSPTQELSFYYKLLPDDLSFYYNLLKDELNIKALLALSLSSMGQNFFKEKPKKTCFILYF